MITQAQIEKLIELSAPLTVNPLPWSELTEEQQDAFRSLMPRPSFDDIQRHYLSLWWLPVTEGQVEELNGMVPNFRVSPRKDIEGNDYICADLLSDAIDGRSLSNMWDTLSTLPLTYRTSEHWPIPEEI